MIVIEDREKFELSLNFGSKSRGDNLRSNKRTVDKKVGRRLEDLGKGMIIIGLDEVETIYS